MSYEISDKNLIDSINKSLLENYRVLDGRPIYRVAWSDDQLEIRCGTFTDWYGPILIRQEHKAVREIKKYWYFPKPYWVLEKLSFINGYKALKDIVEELVDARNGTYEPIHVFRDASDNATPVSLAVVNIILHTLHNPLKKMTESDFAEIERIEEEREVQHFEDVITDTGRSDLFLYDLGQWVSSNQKKFRETYVAKTGPIDSGETNVRPILSS